MEESLVPLHVAALMRGLYETMSFLTLGRVSHLGLGALSLGQWAGQETWREISFYVFLTFLGKVAGNSLLLRLSSGPSHCILMLLV